VASWIDPLIFGHDATLQPIPYDVSKAKQLLSGAGYADGFETTLRIYPLGSFVDSSVLAQAILPYLQAVGIRADIQQVSTAQIGDVIRSGKAGPMFIHTNESAGAFDAGLDFSFLDATSVFSYAGDDMIAQLRTDAGTSTDMAHRKQVYGQLERYVQDYAPFIFGWTGFLTYGVGSKVDYTPQADNLTRLYLATPK
jgi:peptide/nickel transport system substrate-binding protein